MNIIALIPKDIFKSKVMLSVYEEPRSISGSFGINFRKDGTFELYDTILGVGGTFEGRYTIENEVITLLDEYPKIPTYFRIRGNELIYLDNNKEFDEESYRHFKIEEPISD